jgi:hypothetical protein
MSTMERFCGLKDESLFKKMRTNDPKSWTEACVKMGGKYVLFDAASAY